MRNHKKTFMFGILFLAGSGVWMGKIIQSNTIETRYIVEAVEKGTLVTSVTGTGQIQGESEISVVPETSGKVIQVAVQNGQYVQEGEVLAVLDSTDATKSVRDARLSLASAKLSLQKLYKLTANYLLTEIPRIADVLKIIDYSLPEKITAENFSEFIVLIEKGEISSSAGQLVLKEKEKKIIAELLEIIRQEMVLRFAYAKKLAEEPKRLKEILETWLGYFREILISAVHNHNKEYSLAKLSKILKLIQTTDFLIATTNVNARLALEILMLEL